MAIGVGHTSSYYYGTPAYNYGYYAPSRYGSYYTPQPYYYAPQGYYYNPQPYYYGSYYNSSPSYYYRPVPTSGFAGWFVALNVKLDRAIRDLIGCYPSTTLAWTYVSP